MATSRPYDDEELLQHAVGAEAGFVSVEGMFPVRYGGVPLFCLQTARRLWDSAWEVYWNPAGLHAETERPCGKQRSLSNLPRRATRDEEDMALEALETVPDGMENEDPDRPLDLKQYSSKWRIAAFMRDDKTDTCALVARYDHRIVLSFRGTSSTENVKTDLAVQQIKWEPYCPVGHRHSRELSLDAQEAMQHPTHKHHTASTMEAKMRIALKKLSMVHSGFQRAYLKVRDDAIESICKLVESMNKTSTSTEPCIIEVTGHSLGGALAVLAAIDLAFLFDESVHIQMYTFGAPRVGNSSFSKLFNAHVPHSFRVVNDQDLIPRVPKLLFKYKHVGIEARQDRYGNLLVNPSTVERVLGRSGAPADHAMLLYRKHLDGLLQLFGPDDR